MDNFLAAWLFLNLGFALMVVGLIWRYWFLYIASGLCWGIAGIYSLIVSHTGEVYVWAFAFFCLAMSILMFWANWLIPRKFMKRGEYTPFNTAEDWETKEGKQQHDKLWGKSHKEQEIQQEVSKSERRKAGEWLD